MSTEARLPCAEGVLQRLVHIGFYARLQLVLLRAIASSYALGLLQVRTDSLCVTWVSASLALTSRRTSGENSSSGAASTTLIVRELLG